MSHCWEQRGCDAEMQSRCPHNTPGEPCPAECHFAACERPTHVITTDFELLFRPDLDREVSVKDICSFCEFFLKNGPARPADKPIPVVHF